MGNYDLSTDQFSPLLGVFFGVSTIVIFMFLNRVQGKPYRLQDFLADRKWHLIHSETVILRINWMLKITCWFLFFMPIITLIIWGSGVIARLDDDNESVAGGVAILL